MTKVYIVTSGEYSDYSIKKVFSSLEKAEKYCARVNVKDEGYSDFYYGACYVEEFNLDDCEVSDSINVFYEYLFYFENQNNVEPIITSDKPVTTVRELPYDSLKHTAVCVTLNERNYAKAKKIQQDYLAKKKAEQNGL